MRTVRLRHYLAMLAVLLLGAGCRSPVPADLERRQRDLVEDFVALGAVVSRGEAERAADCAVQTALELARTYRTVQPAWFHNWLVHTGIRQRGLCYEWADDLASALRQLGLRSLRVHLVVAHPGSWREHNGVAISAAGQSPLEGILLDAWRHGGRLYWSSVKADNYPWQVLQEHTGAGGTSP